jgi:hypothetical protein
MTSKGYDNLNVYYGDIHNHCNVGYGHGSIEDSYDNARLQLDFACVSVHAHWADMPEGEARLVDVVNYHKKGFAISREAWNYVQEVVEDNHQPEKFISFLGFEWHSMEHGDRNIIYNSSKGEIIPASTLDDLHAGLRRLASTGIEGFAIAHHIGYKQGYRGINWETFDPVYSPVVEIMSMHGASESDDTAYPFLHTMGPRDRKSTYHYGLERGHVVGAIGSTDHHSAHPGSYGHGRMAVWSPSLTRDGIWEAVKNRRTYALTGDKIDLEFSINGAIMGSIIPYQRDRNIEIAFSGGDVIDYVELLFNNNLLYRLNGHSISKDIQFNMPVKVYIEVGWGEKDEHVEWEVELELVGGKILDVEPRFRGPEVVAPTLHSKTKNSFSSWKLINPNRLRFSTMTWGNPTTTTASTQGVSLEMEVNPQSRIRALFNNQAVDISIMELIKGASSGYLGGFLTPAYRIHQAVPLHTYRGSLTFQHNSEGRARDWYTVRVRQKNGQWAWSSPIWVEANSNI